MCPGQKSPTQLIPRNSSGFRTGSGRNSTEFNKPKTAVLAPIPNASDITARFVKIDADPTNLDNYKDYVLPGVENGQVVFYTPVLAGMFDNFVGSVFISSNDPIVAVTNYTNYSIDSSLQVPTTSYTNP